MAVSLESLRTSPGLVTTPLYRLGVPLAARESRGDPGGGTLPLARGELVWRQRLQARDLGG